MKKLLNYIELVPASLMSLILILSNIYEIIESIYYKTNFNWFYVDRNFLFTIIAFLVIALFKDKRIKLQFIGIIIIYWILKILNPFEPIANWLFFQSDYQEIFSRLAAKDANIIAMMTIIILSIINLLLEIINSSYNLKRIFILLASGSIIVTTILFHYYIINKSLNSEKIVLLQRMKKVSNIMDVPSRMQLCSYEGYYCVSEIPEEKTALAKFAKTSKNKVTSGHFSLDGKLVSIVRRNNNWVVDESRYERAFKSAESTFLSLCSFAHGFWLLFLLFLISTHYNRRRAK